MPDLAEALRYLYKSKPLVQEGLNERRVVDTGVGTVEPRQRVWDARKAAGEFDRTVVDFRRVTAGDIWGKVTVCDYRDRSGDNSMYKVVYYPANEESRYRRESIEVSQDRDEWHIVNADGELMVESFTGKRLDGEKAVGIWSRARDVLKAAREVEVYCGEKRRDFRLGWPPIEKDDWAEEEADVGLDGGRLFGRFIGRTVEEIIRRGGDTAAIRLQENGCTVLLFQREVGIDVNIDDGRLYPGKVTYRAEDDSFSLTTEPDKPMSQNLRGMGSQQIRELIRKASEVEPGKMVIWEEERPV